MNQKAGTLLGLRTPTAAPPPPWGKRGRTPTPAPPRPWGKGSQNPTAAPPRPWEEGSRAPTAAVLPPGGNAPAATPLSPPTAAPPYGPGAPPLPPPGQPPAAADLPGDPIVVAAEGSGGAQALLEAVEQAPPGSILRLQAGTYHLDAPLVLNKSLCLEGEGVDRVRLLSSAPAQAVWLAGAGEWSLQDLTFEHYGPPAHGVVVQGGGVQILRCAFTGGVRDTRANRWGNGLLIQGSGWGQVADCDFHGNGWQGLSLSDQAQVLVEGCRGRENREFGLVFGKQSGGTARGNHCARNGRGGIGVNGSARATLEGNCCPENLRSGILFWGHAKGTARQNECCRNSFHGIEVCGPAGPVLEFNRCAENGRAGITFSDRATGGAYHNECLDNQQQGVRVESSSRPQLRDNICSGNGEDGSSGSP